MTDEKHSPFDLARTADVASPDSATSPGAEFLLTVAACVPDLAQMVADGYDSDDSIHELADGCVPVYTHERWQVFVDLAAYDEDTDELCGADQSMTDRAAVALYVIAERLLGCLWVDAVEEMDS